MATHVYLARWVWNAAETVWQAPLPSIGALDLRSLTECGTQGGAGGLGLFAYPSTVSISGATYLGADFAALNTTRRNALNNGLGVNLTANESLDRVINKLLMENADPGGQTKWRPLRIGKSREVQIWFAGQSLGIGTVQDDEAGFIASLDARKADYARAKLSGVPIEALRKWNGYDLIKYWGSRDSSKLSLIVPADSINDGSDPPETTISDNFNRANEALDTGGVWVEVSPTDWTVTSNQVVYGSATATALARHATALSSDDHKASVSVTAIGASGLVGAAARSSTDAAPNHDTYIVGLGATSVIFRKIVNGSATDLDTSKSVTPSVPDTIEIECNNSTMISRFNGVQQHNFTDTSLTGNLYCGLYMRRTTDALDDFNAQDLTTGYTLTAESGTYTYSGGAATALHGRLLTAENGSFPYSGGAGNALRGYGLVAETGSFPYAGGDANIKRDYMLSPETGSYPYSGGVAELLRNLLLSPETGTFPYSGGAADLFRGVLLSPESGAFPYSGGDGNLLRGLLLIPETGDFPYSGGDANALRGLLLSAETGSFPYSGGNATASVAGAGSHTLLPDTGSFPYSGGVANAVRTYLLNPESGSFPYSGQDAAALLGRLLTAEGGSFPYQGGDANLLRGVLLIAENGSYPYSGGDAEARRTYILVTETGVFAYSGGIAVATVGGMLVQFIPPHILTIGTGHQTISVSKGTAIIDVGRGHHNIEE